MDDKVMFFCIFLIIIGIVVFQYFSHSSDLTQIKNSLQNPICPSCPKQQEGVQEQRQKINVDVNQTNEQDLGFIPPPDPFAPLRDYDYRALNDPLVPPLKRDDYNITVYPIATRGYPSGYKKIGLLIDQNADNQDRYKFLILVGRQKYPGSTQYDYFVTENKHDSALKFELRHIHKELYTDDEVEVKELDKTYKVKIDRSLGFEYNPFMY